MQTFGHYIYFPSGITPDCPVGGTELFLSMIVNFTYIKGKYLSVVLLIYCYIFHTNSIDTFVFYSDM